MYLPAFLYRPSTTSFMQASARELLVSFFTPFVWCGPDSNPQPPAERVDTLPTELSGRSNNCNCNYMKIDDAKYDWPKQHTG